MREATDNHISTFLYDNANRMIAMANSYNETTRESEIYTYYPNGNKKSVTDITGKVTQYTYDNAGRLTAETVDGSVTAYTYDGYNNRIGKTENGQQTSYTYDSRNRLTKETVTENEQTAVTSYQYDPNGNLYSRQTLTYRENITQKPKAFTALMGYTADTDDMLLEYNNFNQLTAVTKGNDVVTYDYYANGMRKSKTVDGVITTHIWDGQNIVGEFIDGQFAGYLRGNRLIARQTANTTQYYHFNGHGDTLSMTDGNGSALQNYTYDAFGNVANHHDFDTNPFRYCGEYFDQETGFIYLRARYYSPEIGRFVSEDPARDGLNWYAYCANNPVMFVDPMGLHDQEVNEWINNVYMTVDMRIDLRTLLEETNGVFQIEKDIVKIQALGGYAEINLSDMNDGVHLVNEHLHFTFEEYFNLLGIDYEKTSTSLQVSPMDETKNRIKYTIEKDVSEMIFGIMTFGVGTETPVKPGDLSKFIVKLTLGENTVPPTMPQGTYQINEYTIEGKAVIEQQIGTNATNNYHNIEKVFWNPENPVYVMDTFFGWSRP